jgi:putative spermidine/putrescine transport system permease protein
VALPILMPSILGATVLLFANAFGAFVTAYALTGGAIPIVAVQIGAQISGDVLQDQGLGYAMAIGMVAVIAVALALYLLLQRRTERWIG